MSASLDQQRQRITREILRASISLSVLFILVGLGIFLARGGIYVPRTPSGSIGAILSYVWQGVPRLHASAYLDAGVLVLLFTPLARLAAGVVANIRAQDWVYVLIGLLVLSLVLLGLLMGQSGS